MPCGSPYTPVIPVSRSLAVCEISGVCSLASSVPLPSMKLSRCGICSRSDGTLGLSRLKWTLSNWMCRTCLIALGAPVGVRNWQVGAAAATTTGVAAGAAATVVETSGTSVARRQNSRLKGSAVPRRDSCIGSMSGFPEVLQCAQHWLLFGVELVGNVFEDAFGGFTVGGDPLESFADDLVAVRHQLPCAVLRARLGQLVGGRLEVGVGLEEGLPLRTPERSAADRDIARVL